MQTQQPNLRRQLGIKWLSHLKLVHWSTATGVRKGIATKPHAQDTVDLRASLPLNCHRPEWDVNSLVEPR
eukprot:6161611-Lingulodinium_polyedra.AAC.1